MARGRMLNQTVCASLKFQHLSDDTCRLLATWILPHLDLNGVFYADPAMVKSAVFPRRVDITTEHVAAYLDDIEEIGLIVRFEANGDLWQWWPGFADNQVGLRRDRESSTYPLPPRQNGGELAAPIPPPDGKNPAEEKRTENKGREARQSAGATAPARSPKKAKYPAAVDAFRENAHRFPAKAWYETIGDVVGEEPTALERWGHTVFAWVGLGWNPTNVKGMLDCYQKGEIPGEDRNAGPPGNGDDQVPKPPVIIEGLYRDPEYLTGPIDA